MRVLRRESDRDPDAVDTVGTDDTTTSDTTTDNRSVFDRFRSRDRDGDGDRDRDDARIERRAAVTEPPPTEPPPTEPVPTTTPTREREVVVEPWSVADAVVAVIGAGLALVGALVLVRTGIDSSWFRPVEEVADFTHTPLLGAIEVGAGVLLMLAAAARGRALPALVGLGIAIAGAMAAIENAEVARELAIEESWAWILAGVGLLATVVSLVPPRRRRVERLVES